MLKLERPLVFFDLETTDSSAQTAKIVSYCFIKYSPNEKKRQVLQGLVNPLSPIPPGATEVNGITNEMVKDAPRFSQVYQNILEFIDGCDLAGHNINRFDVLVLYNHFSDQGIDWDVEGIHFVDTMAIFTKREPRTLTAALLFYCNEELVDAHNAQADVLASAKVLAGQYNKYPTLPVSVAELAAECKMNNNVDLAGTIIRDENNVLRFGIGKHKGEKVVDYSDYARWMLGASFNRNTKKVIRKILNGELS